MERRYAKELRERTAEERGARRGPGRRRTDSGRDVRAFAAPAGPDGSPARRCRTPAPRRTPRPRRKAAARRRPAVRASAAPERARRSKVLARRRRTTVILFLAFTLGAIVAAVGGLALPVGTRRPRRPAQRVHRASARPGAPALRVHMDRRRAEAAAQRLREQPPRAGTSRAAATGDAGRGAGGRTPSPEPRRPAVSPQEAGRRALVEQTDHAEWVDQQRERAGPARGDSWDPVPVPLPTYVTAPVAPRATSGVDLSGPGDLELGPLHRTADPTTRQPGAPEPRAAGAPHPAPRRTRDRGRTPLFDQYEDEDRPRAANE